MKKLLYTLILAATFVACDKDNQFDTQEVLAIENIVVENSNVNVDLIVENLIGNLQNYGKSKKGTAAVAGKGADFVAIHIFVASDVTYMTLLDETNDDLCFGETAVQTVFFDNKMGDGSVLSVENSEGVVSVELEGNFAAFFDGGNNILIKLDSASAVDASADFDANNIATF